MIEGNEKCNRQLAFELQNSHVCEKRSNTSCRRVLVIEKKSLRLPFMIVTLLGTALLTSVLD